MEACLPKVVDRGPLLLTLGAAGATLLVMLAVLLVPALDACRGDGRGLLGCLRGILDERFELGLDPQPVAHPPVPPIESFADAGLTPEPTRSLAPPVADKPVAPPPRVGPTVPVPAEPQTLVAPVETAEVEQADAAPAPATIAGAEIVEPAAPSFILPPPAVAVDGTPPDLQVAAATPDSAAPAPDFALPQPPDLPPTPPPDLVAVARITATDAPDAPELPEPVAVADPAGVAPVADVAPAFVLPSTPDLPTAPPRDLTVAVVDPVVPTAPPSPAAPVLAPTIDAVEIDGDGSFIAGDGPAGATMRLYVDGIPVGVSPVEGGRWLVESANLLTEPTQTLKVEALDPLTGKVLGEAAVAFERPAEPVADGPADAPLVATPGLPAPIEAPEPVAEPQPVIVPPALQADPASANGAAAADESEPASVPPIAPIVPAGETPSVTILKPASPPDITTLTTGEPSDGAIVNLGALPKPPAIVAHFTLGTTEVASDVTVLRAVPVGDPGAGRFVSGKAIIRRGDTLWDIAHRYYGLGVRYRTILRANSDVITRPGRIYPGQVLDLPLVYDD